MVLEHHKNLTVTIRRSEVQKSERKEMTCLQYHLVLHIRDKISWILKTQINVDV